MKSSLLLLRLVLGALVLSALHAVAVAQPAAAAAVRWASPAGTGTDCTESAPCSLVTAVQAPAVQDGDEVVVMPGAYTVPGLEVTKAITLHGEAGQPRPTITSSAVVGFFDAATVRDLHFVHSTGNYGLWVNAAGVLVERVTSKMEAGSGFACAATASSTWRDSLCWAVGANTRGLGANSGLLPGTYEITLRNLTIVGEGSGMDLGYNGAGVNVVVDAKNVIANSPGQDVRADAQSGANVHFTLASSNYGDTMAVASPGATASVTEAGSGTNQTAAPVFVDAANGDFHQAEGSPTIDAGVADPANGSTDFEGDSRAVRGTTAACPEQVDIGADERVTALECDPPETTIPTGPDPMTADTTPTFGLSSDEPGATFECRVDAGAFAPCATPYTTAVLGLGSHTVHARATDASGNVDETPATRSFTVAAPDTTLTRTPRKKVLTKKRRAKVTFAFTSTTPGSFECSLDGAAFTACTSPLTFRAKLGRHTMQVRAVSASGLVDATPSAYTFKVKRRR